MFPFTEPSLATDAALLGILQGLRQREPIFHRPELGSTRADFDRLMTADFWEVGASGRRYSRDYVLDQLERRAAEGTIGDKLQATDFHCRRLAEDVYLLTYTLFQPERRTRRATIWRSTESGWKIVFHQGTIVQDA
jgi:hypothetical protein